MGEEEPVFKPFVWNGICEQCGEPEELSLPPEPVSKIYRRPWIQRDETTSALKEIMNWDQETMEKEIFGIVTEHKNK